MLVSLTIWIALSEQLDFTINHDYVGSGKQPNFGPNSHYVSHQYFKLEIKPAAEGKCYHFSVRICFCIGYL